MGGANHQKIWPLSGFLDTRLKKKKKKNIAFFPPPPQKKKKTWNKIKHDKKYIYDNIEQTNVYQHKVETVSMSIPASLLILC